MSGPSTFGSSPAPGFSKRRSSFWFEGQVLFRTRIVEDRCLVEGLSYLSHWVGPGSFASDWPAIGSTALSIG